MQRVTQKAATEQIHELQEQVQEEEVQEELTEEERIPRRTQEEALTEEIDIETWSICVYRTETTFNPADIFVSLHILLKNEIVLAIRFSNSSGMLLHF